MKNCISLKIASLLTLSIVFTSCTPKETQDLLKPTQALGKVLADETAQIAGTKKRVVIITPDASWGGTSSAEKSFATALKKRGFTVVDTKAVNVGDPMKSGQVGLKMVDVLEALQKFPDVGAIVSFAGAPLVNLTDIANFPAEHPPLLVVAVATLGEVPGVATARTQLGQMLDAKIIQLAIIDGPESTGQKDGKPNPDRELFAQHYQTMRLPGQ
ncbi:MAG: hypothetical protein JWQ71_542 [Pedosphaera sp.]|nr:hypothetical protein [Pedosphaera sp.]